MRPELAEIVTRLLAAEAGVIELDSVAEAIDVAAVSTQDVDDILTALERAGRTIGVPGAPTASAGLSQVLAAARRLRAQLGRVPSAAEIAQSENMELSTVRVALLFARIVQR